MKHTGPSQRQLRVGEQVRHALASVFQRGVILDPMLDGVVLSATEVKMSPDLRVATCFVAPLADADGEEVVKALNHHTRFIRGEMGPELRQLKYMPEFRFKLDTSFDNFAKIDALLHSPEVARDLHHDGEDDGKEKE